MHRFVHTNMEQLIVESLVHKDFANIAVIQDLYRRVDDKELFNFAQEHEVASIVAKRLQVFTDPAHHWLNAMDAQRATQSARLTELHAIASLLAEQGISLVALKNAGIAAALYPYPEECPMGDMDVLVQKVDFAKAHAILEQNGYILDFRVAETIEEKGLEAGLLSGGTEYQKVLPNGETLWLELQWRPVAGRWIAPEIEPNAEALFQTAIPVRDSKLKILDPLHNLLQVCLHTAKHSYIRAPGLRLHTDVDRIVRAYDTPTAPFNWEHFTRMVCELHLKTAVYFSLAFAKQLLHTPIPQATLDALCPPLPQREAILSLLAHGGLFHPLAHKFSRLQYLAFTALLFDSPTACLRTALPSPTYMKSHYNLPNTLHLPQAYALRLANLIFKRSKT